MSTVLQEATMSHAQMIAKAWLDEGFRTALLAQGIDVPARPSDLAEEELVTSVKADEERSDPSLICQMCMPCQ